MIHLKYSDKYIIINKISKHFSQLEAIIARNPGLMAKQGAEVILDASGSKNATEYITTQSEKIAFSAAEYWGGEWRIDGTSDVKGPGVTVTIYLGNPSSNQIIAKVAVDTLGAWRYRGTSLRVTSAGSVTATSPTSTDKPSISYRYRWIAI